MTKATTTTREPQTLSAVLKASRNDAIPFRQALDVIAKTIPFTEGFITSSLPRGALQIVQPPKLPEMLFRSYSRHLHTADRATWQAIIQQRPLRAKDVWPGDEFENSRYAKELLHPLGLRYLAVAPMKAPVFLGYPGALHLYRTAEQGDFSDAELSQLAEIAKQLDEAIDQIRTSRRPPQCAAEAAWSHRPAIRTFVLDAQLKPLISKADLSVFDERLRQQLTQHISHRLQHLGDEEIPADRLQAPDSRGDIWTFRIVIYRQYPAFGTGPVVVVSLQPESCDWATIRPTDFQADTELFRLVPALRFMYQEFHRSPTLGEISKQVHLSPFHFHRRFTELLGLTPKHFLLECQIFEAKRQLIARQKQLAQIATDCGFAHQSHFTSRFKQATGLTPTRWRRLATDLQRA